MEGKMKWIRFFVLVLVLIVSLLIGYSQSRAVEQGQYCSYYDREILCQGNPLNCICPIIIEPPQ